MTGDLYDDFDDEQAAWEDLDEPTMTTSLGLLVAVPIVTGLTSLGMGLVIGIFAGWLAGTASQPTPEAIVAAIDPNDIEFGQICAPVITEAQTEIDNLNVRIRSLETDIADREQALAQMEEKMKRPAKPAAASPAPAKKNTVSAAAYARLKEELATVKQERDMLVEVKQQLVDELTRTVARLEQTEGALEVQIQKTELARTDAIQNNWLRFLNESQLQICEKGNRKKLGQCREIVVELLGRSDVQRRFEHCLRSGQATPYVAEVAKGEEPPEYSFYLDQEDKVVKDWSLNLCDPSLPENVDGVVAQASLL